MRAENSFAESTLIPAAQKPSATSAGQMPVSFQSLIFAGMIALPHLNMFIYLSQLRLQYRYPPKPAVKLSEP